jgi:acetolactate synthase-1/2/3 large subunit
MSTTTGADVFVQALRARGVEFLTTVSGNGTEPVYDACRRAGVRLVDFRNEQAAAFAADAAARLTRRLHVCAVSSAVGHANALIGVVNAWFDGSPVLLFSGASPHARTDVGKFQDMDHVAVAAPITKYARVVDRPERIPFYVSEAYGHATSGRPGPVHLTIPFDVLSAEVQPPPGGHALSDAGEVRPRAAADPALVAKAAELVAGAERPLLVAGSGAFYARADQPLAAFAAATAMPIVVPIWDRGAVTRPSDHFLGVIGAASGGPCLLPDADLVLLVGARIDYRVGYAEPPELSAEARIIRIDVDAGELCQGREPDLAIQADPASALASLTSALAENKAFVPRREWLAETQLRSREFQASWSGRAPASPMSGQRVVEALQPFLQDDQTVFLVDGGNIGQWAHVLADRYPGNWLTCGASGVVGWGVAGAVAAKLTYPERPVILLSGDGAIGFGLSELETAVRHATPFVVVLADNRAWGSVVSWQTQHYGPEGVIASRLGPVAYDQVAEGFGAIGRRVERAEEIGPAVERGLAANRPTLIHVPTAVGGPADFAGASALPRGVAGA